MKPLLRELILRLKMPCLSVYLFIFTMKGEIRKDRNGDRLFTYCFFFFLDVEFFEMVYESVLTKMRAQI